MLEQEVLVGLVDRIWFEMLHLNAHPEAVRPEGISEPIHAHIEFSGHIGGRVDIVCPKSLVSRAAAEMFALKSGDVGDQDRSDVMLELINMLGGNVKAIVADELTLSLPSIAYDGDVATRENSIRQDFACAGERFSVVLTPQ